MSLVPSADATQAADAGFGERPAGVGNPKVGIRDPEADAVSAAFFTGRGVVRVLEQFIGETALAVVSDFGFLTGILTKPDGACPVDGESLVADPLKKAIAIAGQDYESST